ncbi:TRAP transporter substrate-binding protein [Thalassospira sp. UBA1131]|uniref:TRAP transporter substrate-binding protein n=1 Tax=Thalassospira sp. UBA1131 TaxID=1947672 RepID=UPI0025EB2CA5|nr:TRAP transporter substrate-binding protein [Thalassospira sp. UBA1131]
MKLWKSVCFAAFGGMMLASPAMPAEKIVIAFAGQENLETDAEYVFINSFSQSLKKHGIETQVHPSNSLGKETDRFDQTSQGLINVNVGNVGMLFKASEFASTLFLPFLFSDDAQFDDVLARSGAYDKINEEAAPLGIKVAGVAMRGGSLGLFNIDHPVTKFEDVKSLRLRAQNGDQVKFFEAWGAKATIVSWAETPNALQTGVAQGHYNPPSTVVAAGQVELLKYFTPLDGGPVPRVIFLSSDWYDSLDDETRGYVDQAIEDGIAANRKWAAAKVAEFEQIITDGGIKITPLEAGEREKFVEATKAVWPEIADPDDIAFIEKYMN